VDVGPSFCWLEDHGVSIAPEISPLTGIFDGAISDRRIFDDEATLLILEAGFIVARNAGFDRSFVKKRLQVAGSRPWICSMREVNRRGRGFEG
jgi:DNA polymerase-3 subunit epsilon